jgi:hypothetical protein
MEDYSQFVPDVYFEKIPIKNLVSSQAYQRKLRRLEVKRTVKDFNLHQINPVKISRRDGLNYVFNGQHTIETIAAASGSRETPVWCMIYDDLHYQKEARVFARQQNHVKPLSAYEIFMANIEAGEEQQLIIKDLVESYGLHITTSKAPGGIGAISTLEYIHEKFGLHVLDRTLRLSIGTWEGEKNSLAGCILRGIARLIVAYGDELKETIFKEKVGKCSIKELSRLAKDRKAGSIGYAEAMLILYNKKLRMPLKWEKLYNTNDAEQEVFIEYEEGKN